MNKAALCCMLSVAGVICGILPSYAVVATNSFVVVEGEGVSMDDDGSVVRARGATGPVKVTARPGWLVNGKDSAMLGAKGRPAESR